MPSRAAATVSLLAALTLAACSSNRQPDKASSQLDFGVDMARRGLWHEALFRFEAAERLDPNNARVQSDIGVAYEAAGQFDKALSYYQNALDQFERAEQQGDPHQLLPLRRVLPGVQGGQDEGRRPAEVHLRDAPGDAGGAAGESGPRRAVHAWGRTAPSNGRAAAAGGHPAAPVEAL